ncbi:MAG TPA: LCP family protein [Conexibacter sp.]|nr:LCP family protein [Conexibacter sp.]
MSAAKPGPLIPPPPPEFPRRGGIWWRFLVAGVVIVLLSAGVTATVGLTTVQSFVNDLNRGATIKGLGHVITEAQAGEPQTLLLIGSDHRFRDASSNARSDTMMLVRLDPHANATTVLSMPRDLRVDFQTPGGAWRRGAKLNETYTDGGEALTARVIEQLLNVRINHIVNINFGGFSAAIDAIGCVYVDVDQNYNHTNVPGGDQYSEIHIRPGYQKLCGQDALSYVRYRHTDTDFVRAARQQAFLRDVKSQYGVGKFVSDPHLLTRIVGRYSSTDPNLHSVDALLKLADLVIYSAGKPVRQIQFPPDYLNLPGASYVIAGPDVLAQMRHQFLEPPPKDGVGGSGSGSGKATGGGRRGRPHGPSTSGLAAAASVGQSYAIQLGGGLGFPIYYPKLLASGGQYMSPIAGAYPRNYRIRAPDGTVHAAYRIVVRLSGDAGNYYGIEGTTWHDPPILRNPSADRRVVDGKPLELFYDGVHLRLVAWRTPQAVYWISNSLQEKLTNDQMLALAGSLTRLGTR